MGQEWGDNTDYFDLEVVEKFKHSLSEAIARAVVDVIFKNFTVKFRELEINATTVQRVVLADSVPELRGDARELFKRPERGEPCLQVFAKIRPDAKFKLLKLQEILRKAGLDWTTSDLIRTALEMLFSLFQGDYGNFWRVVNLIEDIKRRLAESQGYPITIEKYGVSQRGEEPPEYQVKPSKTRVRIRVPAGSGGSEGALESGEGGSRRKEKKTPSSGIMRELIPALRSGDREKLRRLKPELRKLYEETRSELYRVFLKEIDRVLKERRAR